MFKSIVALLSLVFFCFGCDENSSASKTNDFGGLKAIEIFSEYQPVAANTLTQMSAIGVFYDEPSRDITSEVAWQSQDPDIATIDGSGLAEGVSAGDAIITATLNGQQGEYLLEVVDATIVNIDVVPLTLDLPVGISQQYIAYGTFIDVTSQFVQDITNSVTWDTTDADIAVIDQTGLATATGTGTVDVEAEFDGLVGSAVLTAF